MGRRGREEEEKKVRNFNSGGLGTAEYCIFGCSYFDCC